MGKTKPYRFLYTGVFVGGGFYLCCLYGKKVVLITLAPIAILTLFYSTPVFKSKKNIFRFREIPYLKIFMIAFVWSAATILLPVIQSGNTYWDEHVIQMFFERFLFIFAITIPFDIRDIEADRQGGLKTLPLLLNEKRSMIVSYLSLLIFFIISFFHYRLHNHWFIIWALGISAFTTFIFLYSKKVRALHYYHYGVLDGTMLLQGLLVYVFFYLEKIIH